MFLLTIDGIATMPDREATTSYAKRISAHLNSVLNGRSFERDRTSASNQSAIVATVVALVGTRQRDGLLYITLEPHLRQPIDRQPHRYGCRDYSKP